MTDPWLVAALAFGLSQVSLSLLLVVLSRHWGLGECLFGLLMLAVASYLLTPFLGQPVSWWVSSLATAVPGMFWLFSAYVFDDHFRLRGWQIGLVASTVVLPVIGELTDASGLWYQLLFTLPQLLEFVLLGLTLWVVAQNWQVDLVASRRRLRWWFVAVNGSYIFALILLREWLFEGERWFALAQYLPVGPMLLGINLLLLQYKPGVLFAATGPAPAVSTSESGETPIAAVVAVVSAADPALIGALQTLMRDGAVYREMGLTIGQLATRLDTPQYRLRQAINTGLGYRNFNDFLNSYRIAEAVNRLQDPAADSLPILTIAMDAGFRSLSSFNKAFKDAQGITPTAYRKSIKKQPI